MEQFCMILPSNASMEIHADNTISNFVTGLSQAVELVGSGWEVALTEIIFPNSQYTIGPDESISLTYVYTNSNKAQVIYRRSLQEGFYQTVEELIEHIRELLVDGWESVKGAVESRFGIDPHSILITIEYNKRTNKITVKTTDCSFVLKLSPLLADMLGLKILTKPSLDMLALQWTGDYVDLKRGRHALYVYCSLVQDTVVGDKRVPLLRALTMSGDRDGLTRESITEPIYIPLRTLCFNSIEINLRTETGKSPSFTSGHSIVTLHFRRNALAW
jgi:hypothetical protein